jgi:hypothetical protein
MRKEQNFNEQEEGKTLKQALEEKGTEETWFTCNDCEYWFNQGCGLFGSSCPHGHIQTQDP